MSQPSTGGFGPAPQPPQGGQGGHPPQGPGSPPGPGGPQGPGGPAAPPPAGGPKKRRWPLIVGALGCVALLVLVGGIGVAFWAFSRGGEDVATEDPTPSVTDSSPVTTPSGDADAPAFEVISPLDEPPGSVEELWAVQETSPLTQGSITGVGECELPGTPEDPSTEELQATLEAATACLNGTWATTSSDRNLPWVSPKVVVYEYPDIPAETSCEADTFAEDFPRVCNIDSTPTIYWPQGYGWGAAIAGDAGVTDPAELSTVYLWDLSWVYMGSVAWDSSIGIWYQGLDDALEEADDPELQEEAWRRYNAQMRCIATSVTTTLPAEAQTPEAFREYIADPDHWRDHDLSAESRAYWNAVGFESGGDLTQCNTWGVPADQVT